MELLAAKNSNQESFVRHYEKMKEWLYERKYWYNLRIIIVLCLNLCLNEMKTCKVLLLTDHELGGGVHGGGSGGGWVVAPHGAQRGRTAHQPVLSLVTGSTARGIHLQHEQPKFNTSELGFTKKRAYRLLRLWRLSGAFWKKTLAQLI